MGHFEGSAFEWDGKLLEVLNGAMTRFYCDWQTSVDGIQ